MVDFIISQQVNTIAVIWGYLVYIINIPWQIAILPSYSMIRSIFMNVIFIPFKHAAHIIFYTVVYLPLSPLMYAFDIGFEMQWSSFWDQAKFFMMNLFHFFLVACIFGAVVGVFTGVILSFITFIFNETEMWLLGNRPNSSVDTIVSQSATKHEASEIADIVSYPKLDSFKPSFSSGINTRIESDSIYEDDDGYSGSYLMARNNRSSIKQENDEVKVKYEPRIKEESEINDIPTIKEEEKETLNNEVFSMNLRDRLNTLNTDLTTPENSSKASSK